MNLHILLIIGFALSLSGCGNMQQAAPEQVAAPAYEYGGILKHMHSHADQVDLLNYALADGDLEAAKLPARWLWRHETMTGVPADWQPYMAGMRQAAREAERATDLATARAAATRLNENCQACHSAVGINIDSP